jgi:two-component system sensor histidine kinase KdpD
MSQLIGNLLDMTRLESGGLALKRDWVPLEEVIGSALTRLEGRLDDRPVHVALPGDLPLVSIDPVVFEQVFVNLFDNAAKYAPGSPIEVQASHQGGVVVVEVMDRGPGFPAGTEGTVFDKFYRGPHTGVAGVGLGLAICRGIVEAHGGTIRAENRSGGGALFHLTIPLGGSPPVISAAEEEIP